MSADDLMPLIYFGFPVLCLAIIGWLLILALGPDGPKCLECLGVCARGAWRCRHCGAEL